MTQADFDARRLFILDTNVLMHDPTALFRFKEHDVYLPMVVLEEMDAGKKGVSEVARNVRQVSRFLDSLMQDISSEQIEQGIPLELRGQVEDLDQEQSGRLFFQTHTLNAALPDVLPGNRPDNSILATALALQNEHPDVTVILVSKDINLRIKAAVLGINAEDYFNDQVLEDVNLLFPGITELPEDFWQAHSDTLESWQKDGRNYYRVHGPLVESWHINECVYIPGEQGFEALVREVGDNNAVLETFFF